MYEEFFGLKTRPFASAPDPDVLYWSGTHEFAYTMLRYSAMVKAPVTVVTGQPGVGKTTLVRRLAHEEAEKALVGHVFTMSHGPGELLQWVLIALGVETSESSQAALFSQFQSLLTTVYEEGARVLLIFDDAHNLDEDALEEIRMLSNLNYDNRDVLQIILVGQPELRDRIRFSNNLNLKHRVSFDFVVAALSESETEDYIMSRLKAAGAEREIFSPYVCRLIHQLTDGVPRSVNLVCDMCLTYAYGDEREEVDEVALREFIYMMRDHDVSTPFTQAK